MITSTRPRGGLKRPPARLYPGHRGRGAAPDQQEVNMRQLTRYQSQWPARPVFQDEIKQVFDRFFRFEDEQDESSVVTSAWAPQVDIKEEADRFIIYADLPGIDPSDVEVLMDKGILSIKGERKGEV